MTALADLLENDLRDRFRRGNHLVIWLDADAVYTPFVDRLAARDDFPAEVVGLRGSFLDTLFALEGHANGLDPERLVLHVPGHNDRTIRTTPLLELYHAGHRYEKSFATLVREAATGSVEPEEIERFVTSGETDFEHAERWLESRAAPSRDGLEAWLEGLEDDWIWLLKGLLDPRSHGGHLRERIEGNPDGVAILRGLLHRRTGMSDAFVSFLLDRGPRAPLTLDELAQAFAAWLMSVEYVHDLRAEPRLAELAALQALSPPLVERCRELVGQTREHLPEIYVEQAGMVEKHLGDELECVDPRDLGRIDTFEKESNRMLEAAVEALGQGRFDDTLEWSSARHEESFWLRRDLGRRNAWALAKAAAELGQCLAARARPLDGAGSLDEATERYASGAWEVDRAHRRFEQLRLRVLGQKLPHFTRLLAVTDALRHRYRKWADALGEAFAELCEQHGFLPSAERRQRTFYDQVVHPLVTADAATSAGATVLFLVDALRFEMAGELVDELAEHGAQVRLEARLAELPTITPVGMNVLAPVARAGRLQPRFDRRRRFTGFRTGEFTVSRPEHRLDAMRQRSFGAGAAATSDAVLLDLATVCDAPRKTLARRVKGARLVVVHSREIDETGETDTGLATFESWLQQLSNAWHRLKQLRFGTFVFTADHGFLIQDTTTADPQRYGATRREPKPRWVLSPHAEQPAGCVRVPLTALGYDTRERDAHLILRRDTKVFAAGTSAASFCHGGNSLQERVVPVLTARCRPSSRLRLERYRIASAGRTERRAGVYRLALVIRPREEAQSVLEIARDRDLPVALDVVDETDVAPVIHDVEGGFRRHGRWRVPVGEEVVICFDLRGPHDARVRIRIYHPESDGRVEELCPETFFEVAGTARREPEEPPAAAP
ncbi:MAG: BREX-6 system phosphatase PglZ, partial [bacterium]|nr:BREX-6 system phosphatase PglZ [bacterium]